MKDAFEEFDAAYHEWLVAKSALASGDESNTSIAGFYLDLDHFVSYVDGLAERAMERSTKIAWDRVVAEYFEDLGHLERRAGSLDLPAEAQPATSRFLSASRCLLEKMSVLPVPAEGHLGFTGSVLREFSFLESEYGFKRVETHPICVRFQSHGVFVELEYSENIPIMTFTLGRSRDPGMEDEQFWLFDIAFMLGLGVDFPFDFEDLDLKSRKGIRTLIRKIAQFVKINARQLLPQLLSNDPEAWRRLAEAQQQRDEEYTRMMDRMMSGTEDPDQ